MSSKTLDEMMSEVGDALMTWRRNGADPRQQPSTVYVGYEEELELISAMRPFPTSRPPTLMGIKVLVVERPNHFRIV